MDCKSPRRNVAVEVRRVVNHPLSPFIVLSTYQNVLFCQQNFADARIRM